MITARTCLIALCIAGLTISGCDNSFERKAGDQSLRSASGVDAASSYGIAPAERIALQQRARAGDGEAAYRLARFYGMAGGESGRADDPRNLLEEEKWLWLSAKAGFERGKHSLAVKIGPKDCPAARHMMTEIAETSGDPELRENAQYWLEGDDLCK